MIKKELGYEKNSSPKASSIYYWLTIFAPIYFLAFSFLRCYLECEYFSKVSFYSYYVLLHHTLWNFTLVLTIILIAHLILKVPVKKLLWLMYGVTLMATPLIYSIFTGVKLNLDYLYGSFWEIFLYSVSFCLAYKKNVPISIELILIFISMFSIGYYYSRSWIRALSTAIAVHIAGNFLAVFWVGLWPDSNAIFLLKSRFANHPFLAIFNLHTVTLMVIILCWRGGLFSRHRISWIFSGLWAFVFWIGYMNFVFLTRIFIEPFDILMTGLPVATVIFLLARLLLPKRRDESWYTYTIIVFLLLIQLMVMVPIYFSKEQHLTPTQRGDHSSRNLKNERITCLTISDSIE